MKAYIGFDDTDTLDSDRGTGKLARWFENFLPEECRLWGVLRQQLLVNDAIPYTSHNSAACVVVHVPDRSLLDTITCRAIEHVRKYSLEGSDPGICVAIEGNGVLNELKGFGYRCVKEVVTQRDALRATDGIHLSGHGGTNDGIIGAAAAVGLTATGWCGRFIEFGRLRDFPAIFPVSEFSRHCIQAVSLDRNACVPSPDDMVISKGWVRPRFWGGQAVIPLKARQNGVWECIDEPKGRGGKVTMLP
ncbi:MAG: hypothetical protein JXO48_01060 [Deltaproteobacteria bacterium]|nr:hypothetical protein [Deltaproteobacteria bacterium]